MLKILIFVSTQVCKHAGNLQMYVPAWSAATPERIYVHIARCAVSCENGILQQNSYLWSRTRDTFLKWLKLWRIHIIIIDSRVV